VARALLDKAQATFLTLPYHLDYCGTAIAKFLGKASVKGDAVGSFLLASEHKERNRQKALALGNLLAIALSTDEILAAWKATAGIGDPEAFRQAFGSYLNLEEGVDPWQGWLSSGPYTPGYSPDDLRDSDEDG